VTFASGIRISLADLVAAFFHPVPYHFTYYIAGLAVAPNRSQHARLNRFSISHARRIGSFTRGAFADVQDRHLLVSTMATTFARDANGGPFPVNCSPRWTAAIVWPLRYSSESCTTSGSRQEFVGRRTEAASSSSIRLSMMSSIDSLRLTSHWRSTIGQRRIALLLLSGHRRYSSVSLALAALPRILFWSFSKSSNPPDSELRPLSLNLVRFRCSTCGHPL
jgi:hypothetical protein